MPLQDVSYITLTEAGLIFNYLKSIGIQKNTRTSGKEITARSRKEKNMSDTRQTSRNSTICSWGRLMGQMV